MLGLRLSRTVSFCTIALPGLVSAAEWKDKLKAEIESTWTLSKIGLDRIRITEPGTVFVIKQDGIIGDLASDATYSRTTVDNGHILAPKGAVAFLQDKKTSRTFRAGEKVYVWKTAMDNSDLGLFLISYDTFAANERGGRSTQTRYKAFLDFKFDKDYLPTADLAIIKKTIAQVIVPVAESEAAATKTISLGQSTGQVEDILGRPERIVDLGLKVTYIYKDMKVIFQDGKVADVQ